jgi:NAD-dependent dihydropyrimidine dehydrogenase PreA subunit
MAVIIDQEKCTGCGTCEESCPVEAIKVENEKGSRRQRNLRRLWDVY